MKILVRSLERTVTEAELLKLFQDFGTVSSCKLVLDTATGNRKVLLLSKCRMAVKQ